MNLAESLAVVKRYTGSAPVDVGAIARDLHVPVVYQALGEDVSGAIRASKDGSSGFDILVNSSHALVRQRFTIAHELGHFIYHRDLLGRGTGDTRAYRAEPGTGFPNAHITWVQERQANSFAADTLMPAGLIARYWRQGITSRQALALSFRVSEDAMRIRLEVLGYAQAKARESIFTGA